MSAALDLHAPETGANSAQRYKVRNHDKRVSIWYVVHREHALAPPVELVIEVPERYYRAVGRGETVAAAYDAAIGQLVTDFIDMHARAHR